MTASERKLTGLKEHAAAAMPADLRVSPELKARLYKRIELAEGRPTDSAAERRTSPWIWRSTVAGVAACALVALAVTGQMMTQGDLAVSEESKAAPMEAEVRAPVAAPAPQAPDAFRRDVATVVVSDARGSAVTNGATITAKVMDQSANSVQFTYKEGLALPAGIGVAGVEARPGQKIVLNAEYQLQVTDARGTMQKLQTMAAASGGYVVDAALNQGGDGSWAGRATLRIPSAGYSGAVDQVRQLGDIRLERQWSQDVTEQYMDLEARIRIQLEYEQKLQELAAKASTFDDWMKLTQQINETRARVEGMQGSLKLLSNQVDFSTISITLHQPAPGQPAEPKPRVDKGLWEQMRWSYGESLRVLGGLGRSVMVGLAAVTPFLVPLLAVGGVSLILLKRRRRPE